MASIFKFRKTRGPLDLAVEMAGVRMGERLIQAGRGNPRTFVRLAALVGLTGRACAVVDAKQAAADLEREAAEQGVLVEVACAPASPWPYEDASFDVAVLDGNALVRATWEERSARIMEARRVVRPGARILAIVERPRSVFARLGFEADPHETTAAAGVLLEAFGAAGCRPARVLAEREGLSFIEGFRH